MMEEFYSSRRHSVLCHLWNGSCVFDLIPLHRPGIGSFQGHAALGLDLTYKRGLSKSLEAEPWGAVIYTVFDLIYDIGQGF